MACQRAGSDLSTGPTGLVAGDKALIAYGAVTESLGPRGWLQPCQDWLPTDPTWPGLLRRRPAPSPRLA